MRVAHTVVTAVPLHGAFKSVNYCLSVWLKTLFALTLIVAAAHNSNKPIFLSWNKWQMTNTVRDWLVNTQTILFRVGGDQNRAKRAMC